MHSKQEILTKVQRALVAIEDDDCYYCCYSVSLRCTVDDDDGVFIVCSDDMIECA
jgi:hypothetical protein